MVAAVTLAAGVDVPPLGAPGEDTGLGCPTVNLPQRRRATTSTVSLSGDARKRVHPS
jgi:hypothetical protein